MLYELLKPVAGIALGWYYRSIAVAGRSKVPVTGPVFFAVNHPNALVDALVVATVMPRRVGLTAKSTIFSNPLMSAFLGAVGVVPLKRMADMKKEAVAKGIATEGEPNSAAIDAARNADSFRAVSEAMARGKAIVVFPEGISHDAPQLAPLRTGLARMALQAREAMGVRGIKVVPVGLLFERKEEPRTRVLVQIGDPIDVDAFVASSGATDNELVERLTAHIRERLVAVTLNFETADDAARIQAISETMATLLEPVSSLGEGGPSLSSVLAITRRAERVRQKLSGDASPEFREAIALFEQRFAAFRARLKAERIAIADLQIETGATPGARFVVRESVIAVLLTPIAWWGRLTHYVPIRIARGLALRNARNRDEPAMNTIVIGLALVLMAYCVQTVLVWWLFGPEWALVFFATLIPSASSDLRYGDRVERRQERMRTYLRYRERPELRAELLAEAQWLRAQAARIETMEG
ncbi:MAG: lysophospholipid acyltransferase family protein [Gemmatimonas sp.]